MPLPQRMPMPADFNLWTRHAVSKASSKTSGLRLMSMTTFVVLCLLLVISGGCHRRTDKEVSIATINGTPVQKAAFDRFVKFKLGELTPTEPSDMLSSQMLDEYFSRLIILDDAARTGLSVSDSEIGLAGENNPQMKSTATATDARAELAADLLVAKYYRQIVQKLPRFTPEEAQRYLEANKNRMTDPASFDVREIRAGTREEADRLHREVTEGHGDFTSIARSQSEAPSAENGGLSHYFDGQLPEALEKGIKPLKPGEISPVIQSSFGYHIFKLERRIQAHAPEERRALLDQRRTALIEEAIARKNQQAIDSAVEHLIGQATITINTHTLGFTYQGRLGHNTDSVSKDRAPEAR